MTANAFRRSTAPVRPPTQHQLAVMIWIAVFPTLTVLNMLLGTLLADLPVILRTLVLSTTAVPIIIYGFMPSLHKIRRALILHRKS